MPESEVEKEQQVNQILDTIHHRLKASYNIHRKAFLAGETKYDMRAVEIAIATGFDEILPFEQTDVARSETPATPEQIDSLKQIIESARECSYEPV